uniref:Uncharacterized protein n=1 Tax=Anguilla anguilla TaxID=7936 RepID=A0A0E9WRV4_ANGAN
MVIVVHIGTCSKTSLFFKYDSQILPTTLFFFQWDFAVLLYHRAWLKVSSMLKLAVFCSFGRILRVLVH